MSISWIWGEYKLFNTDLSVLKVEQNEKVTPRLRSVKISLNMLNTPVGIWHMCAFSTYTYEYLSPGLKKSR